MPPIFNFRDQIFIYFTFAVGGGLVSWEENRVQHLKGVQIFVKRIKKIVFFTKGTPLIELYYTVAITVGYNEFYHAI